MRWSTNQRVISASNAVELSCADANSTRDPQRDGDNERSAEDNEDTESDASCIVGGHEMSVYGRDLGIH